MEFLAILTKIIGSDGGVTDAYTFIERDYVVVKGAFDCVVPY